MAKSSDERRRAVRLLVRVEQGAFASQLMRGGADPGLRARVLGVLRWQRDLDRRLAVFLKRPLERLDPEVRAVLRLGVFEGARLGVPAPVATDAMVRVVRAVGKASAAGMVNAVLRRALAAPVPASSPDLEWSHPRWLWQRWRRQFGAAAAERAMASAQSPAPPWFWFRDHGARAALEAKGIVLCSHPWCPETWSCADGSAELMAMVAAGDVVVQDPSSQVVARVAAMLAGGTGRALDLCAAPGGKTLLLDRLGSWNPLIAADRAVAKAWRLGRRVASSGVVAADAGRPPFDPEAWDMVLLDAPCSGTGTFRRHPELKWRLNARSIAEAAARQRPLIDGAVGLVAPGGSLVYSTCSVEPEENEAHFREDVAGMEPFALDDVLPAGLPWSATDTGGARILPHEHGDGFTIHILRRVR